MAKKIIILRDDKTESGFRDLTLCFWFAVPTGKELPEPGRQSSYANATSEETTALQNGSVIEKTSRVRLPADYTVAEIKAFAEALYSARESAYTTDQPAIGYPGEYYGTYWDGTNWIAG